MYNSKNGIAENNSNKRHKRLKQLAKTAKLYDPEEVKNDNSKRQSEKCNKIKIHIQYTHSQNAKIKWEKPKYTRDELLPFHTNRKQN